MNGARSLILLLCCLPPFVLADSETDSGVNNVALSDPTRPGGMGAGADGGAAVWRLSATRITASQRSAVINDSRVREGEEINGAKILNIRHAQVDIATPGGPATLRLLPAEVKKNR
ncbi:MAG TPA: hypothetical protein VIR60_00045 [Gammaproteobacteria bacterium]